MPRPNKLLFLDFDGVLHPSFEEANHFCNAPALVGALDSGRCRIVISSSWRHSHSQEELIRLLPIGISRWVVGRTGPAFIGRLARYMEIRSYLDARSPLADWRALDDSATEFPEKCTELIACNPRRGVQLAELDALLRWLEIAPP